MLVMLFRCFLKKVEKKERFNALYVELISLIGALLLRYGVRGKGKPGIKKADYKSLLWCGSVWWLDFRLIALKVD